MLSLDTARKLRDAGLQHDLSYGDYVYEVVNGISFIMSGPPYDEIKEYLLWIPRLDQLLAEIERKGYGGKLYFDYPYAISLCDTETFDCCFHATSDTLEESAARALLWILEQEKGGTAG